MLPYKKKQTYCALYIIYFSNIFTLFSHIPINMKNEDLVCIAVEKLNEDEWIKKHLLVFHQLTSKNQVCLYRNETQPKKKMNNPYVWPTKTHSFN